MPARLEHLEHIAGYAPLALDRLIRIRVGAKRDRSAGVTGGGELRREHALRIGLVEQPCLEIEPG
jgi:hypothetical protein